MWILHVGYYERHCSSFYCIMQQNPYQLLDLILAVKGNHITGFYLKNLQF